MLEAIKKIPQQLNARSWKTFYYTVLLISWAVILFGTFSFLN